MFASNFLISNFLCSDLAAYLERLIAATLSPSSATLVAELDRDLAGETLDFKGEQLDEQTLPGAHLLCLQVFNVLTCVLTAVGELDESKSEQLSASLNAAFQHKRFNLILKAQKCHINNPDIQKLCFGYLCRLNDDTMSNGSYFHPLPCQASCL